MDGFRTFGYFWTDCNTFKIRMCSNAKSIIGNPTCHEHHELWLDIRHFTTTSTPTGCFHGLQPERWLWDNSKIPICPGHRKKNNKIPSRVHIAHPFFIKIITGWWLSLPLWKIWVRHLGWWNSIPNINGKSFQIPWFQSPPTRYNQLIFWSQICVNPHPLGVFQMKRMGSKESRKYQRSQDNNCRRRLSRFNDGSNARRFLLKKTVAKTKSKAKCCCFAMKILLISSYIILYRYISIWHDSWN